MDDLRAERRSIESRLYEARMKTADDYSGSTRSLMIEKAIHAELIEFDTARPEIIEQIRREKEEKIKRDFEGTAVARGTD